MKTNIRIIVQNNEECAADFAERLEGICNDLAEEYKEHTDSVSIKFMTTASDGRQTATIQFFTQIDE